MGLYDVTNPLDGRLYSFEIDGDAPTEQETLEIQQYLASKGKEIVPEDTSDAEGNLFISADCSSISLAFLSETS